MRPDRRLFRMSLLGVALSSAAAGAASCSSSDDDRAFANADDASSPMLDGSSYDSAMAPDTANPYFEDASKSDAGPRPVVCGGDAGTCAKSLVTMLGAEGFCVLLGDGSVACWGSNSSAELGYGAMDGFAGASSATATRVGGLKGIVSLDHTCAVDTNGAAWCWGSGPHLQNDSGDTTTDVTPVKLPLSGVTKIAEGTSTACAVTASGLSCWGSNTYAQLEAPGGMPSYDTLLPKSVAVDGGAIAEMFVGNASFVLHDDGTATSWGGNPPIGRTSSLFPDPYPSAIALSGVSSIDIADTNACAVASGTAYCWGDAFNGVNYLALPTDRALPEPVATPEPVVQIATTTSVGRNGVGNGGQQQQRACAVGVSGDVYCWGSNEYGQAGDGTSTYANTPVKVKGLPDPAAEVRTSLSATCALLTTGNVYCWGDDTFGQLGSGLFKAPSVTPLEVKLP